MNCVQRLALLLARVVSNFRSERFTKIFGRNMYCYTVLSSG